MVRLNGTDHYEVVIVGAGQAGLALGYYLAEQGRKFVIVDRAPDVASAWSARWESLTLFTPRRYDALPGLDFPGDPDGYPGRDEVVAYLRDYAARFDLPLRLGNEATRLTLDDTGFVIALGDGEITADQVVVATGAFEQPRVPGFAGELADDLVQMHSTGYRRPAELPPGRVLVVGGGNTGYQIAEELAGTHEVHLAVGTRQMPLPQRLLGRDAFWWLTKTGIIYKSTETKFGQRASTKETLVGYSPRKLKRLGVTFHSRATRATGQTVQFEDGGALDVDAVIWATGFRSDYGWIDLPLTDDQGRVRHKRGVTEVRGLYMLGMQWQFTRGSALLGFVHDDAAFIAGEVDRNAASLPRATPTLDEGRPAAAATAGQGD
jgi:putative flavoprotein involved in K+ transport